MTIETKFDREDIVYILIGFEIKEKKIDGVYFTDNTYMGKYIQYDVVYTDADNKVKSKGFGEDKVFSTPGELLEALNRTIPLS